MNSKTTSRGGMKDREQIIHDIVFHDKLPKGWKKDLASRVFSSPKGKRLIGELEIFEYQLDRTCIFCKELTPDIRGLSIGCGYELHEVSTKFRKHEGRYYISICKGCRAYFMFNILQPFMESKGRLELENLDESGNLCFNSPEELRAYKSEVSND